MLRVVVQLVFLGALAGLVLYLYGNLTSNLEARGIPTDFGYLSEPAGFTILGSDFRPSQSFRQALIVGTTNTALVAFLGIVLATILGILVGVARLSSNWLVRKAAGVYVETLRNIPVLVIIIFVYLALILRLPKIDDAIDLGFLLSNRGLWVPWFEAGSDAGALWGVAGLGLVLALFVGVWRTLRFNATGRPHHRVLWGLGVFVLVLVIGYFALGRPLSLSFPQLDGRTVEGGLRLIPEYAALLVALSVYTASHIAEIVRGSIQAVPKGQTEAATANQYLNLTKNSSLAVAIGFPEVTRLTRLMIQQVPAPQAIAILMGIYLAFSLGISLVANLINRALALKET